MRGIKKDPINGCKYPPIVSRITDCVETDVHSNFFWVIVPVSAA
jgi:hypothetical protein